MGAPFGGVGAIPGIAIGGAVGLVTGGTAIGGLGYAIGKHLDRKDAENHQADNGIELGIPVQDTDVKIEHNVERAPVTSDLEQKVQKMLKDMEEQFNKKIGDLQAKNEELQKEIREKNEEIKKLIGDNKTLKDENDKLKASLNSSAQSKKETPSAFFKFFTL